MTKNKQKKKNWSHKDLKILVWIIAKYCNWKSIEDVYYGIVSFLLSQNKDDWAYISSVIPGTTE